MKSSPTIAMLFAVSLVAAACGGDRPTAPVEPVELQRRDGKAAERAALLTDVPVAGPLSDAGAPAGTFVGRFTAKRFDIDPATRQLSLTGVLSGTATLLDGTRVPFVNQDFTTPIDLSSTRRQRDAGTATPVSSCESTNAGVDVVAVSFRQVQGRSCDVLLLDLGPLHLDLLGLTVDLSQVVLDVNAVRGPGNLLGNLLCALLGLLDFTALLASITQLLDAINNILAGLNPGGVVGASFDAPFQAAMSDARSA